MEDLSGQRVLVIGASGFLGRHLVRRLGQHNANIYAISRTTAPAPAGVQWICGDATNGVWLQTVVTEIKPNFIYQLTSASEGGQDVRFVLPTFQNDLHATVNSLLAAKACRCRRIILAASMEEPTPTGGSVTISSPYAAAKASAANYARLFHELYDVPVTLLRPFMTYGPGQKPHKVIPYTILSFLKGDPPALSSGMRPVDFVYVQDVVTAFITAALRPESIGATIDLGTGCLMTVREVVEQIHRLIPEAPLPLLNALPDRRMEMVRAADVASAARILDWRASTPLSVGLSQTVEWFRGELVGELAPVGSK